MIQVKDLVKNYTVEQTQIPVLKGIDCTIEKGEFVAILGPSGCGKSTFLNILAGLMRADAGTIILNKENTDTYTEADWDNWRKNQIGNVFQSFHLIPHLSALKNVEMALNISAYGKRGRKKRAKELLCKVGLEHRMNNKPSQLSGGQKQRVAIARALANNPNVILADEPTGALDSATTKEIMDLLKTLNEREDVTIVMVTHDEEIAALADRNIRMQDGKIVEDIILKKKEMSDSPKKETELEKWKLQNKKGMLLIDTLSVALRNLFLKKKRTLLTIFGISIGVCSVMGMMGITNGIADKVNLELNNLSKASVVRIAIENATEVQLEELNNRLTQKKGVQAQEDVYVFDGILSYKKEIFEDNLFSYTDVQMHNSLLYGEYPDNSNEIVVTRKIAEQCMGKGNEEAFIGKKLLSYASYSSTEKIVHAVEKEYVVVGISQVNLFGSGENYITFREAEALAEQSVLTEVNPQRKNVYLTDKNNRTKIQDEVQQEGWEILSSEELIETIDGWIKAIQGFLILVTGISLVISVVMVVIVQYMSVAERVREIGIMRAIGAQKKDVRNIFLCESALIGLLAGGIGTWVATTFGNGINGVIIELAGAKAFELFQISGLTVFGYIVVCIGLCLIAGYFPAKQATKVDTIEVLK